VRLSPRAGLTGLIFGLTLTDVSSAAETKIILSITRCEAAQVQPERLFEYARAELAPRELVLDVGEPIVQAWVGEVRLCHGSPNMALIAFGSAGRRVAERVLDLSDVTGDMRARTLAVALAELFASTTPNARAAGSADEAPPQPPAVATETAPALPPTNPVVVQLPPPQLGQPALHQTRNELSTSNRLSAGAALRQYFSPLTTLVGPWLSVADNRWAFEGLFLTSSKSVENGTVSLYNANIALAYALLSGGQSLTWAARLRGELGMVWANGNPVSPAVVEHRRSRGQGAGAAELVLVNPISRSLGIETRLTTGFATGITATANGATVASTDGVFVGLQLGLFLGWGSQQQSY